MADDYLKKSFWNAFGRGLGARPVSVTQIVGASGVKHRIQAMSLDDERRRALIVVAEASSRATALARIDLQSSIPGYQVIVARPLTFDLGALARRLRDMAGVSSFDFREWKPSIERFKTLDPQEQQLQASRLLEGAPSAMIKALSLVNVPAVNQCFDLVDQITSVGWSSVFATGAEQDEAYFRLDKLAELDTLSTDIKFGVCPLPLYEFTSEDLEDFMRKDGADAMSKKLRDLDIYQYYFPAPDTLALSIIDGGKRHRSDVTEAFEVGEALGHPLDAPELVASRDLKSTLDELTAAGYVAEGEVGFELTDKGHIKRSSLKFRPRESFWTKLLQRIEFKFNFDSKDIFGGRRDDHKG